MPSGNADAAARERLAKLAREIADGDAGALVDWKASAEDALFALREACAQAFPALRDARLDAVAANVNTEPAETWMQALGAEIEALGLRLYEVTQADDAYGLVVLHATEGAGFEQAAKTHGIDVRRCRQTGRARGQGARKLQPADALASDADAALLHISFVSGGALGFGRSTVPDREPSPDGFFSWLDLRQWPPVLTPTRLTVCDLAWSPAHGGLWAALVSPEPGAWTLRVTQAPLQGDAAWQTLPMPNFLKGAPIISIGFAGSDLLVADRNRVWIYRDPATLPASEQVLEAPAQDLRHGKASGFARTGDGRICVLCAGTFHEWRDGHMHATGIQAHGLDALTCAPTGASRFAWVDVGSEHLVEADLDTGKLRTHALAHMDGRVEMRDAGDGWIALLRWNEPSHQYDIAQLWHPATERRLRLGYGALGRAGALAQWFTLPDGRIVVGDFEKAFVLGDLEALVRRLGDTSAR